MTTRSVIPSDFIAYSGVVQSTPERVTPLDKKVRDVVLEAICTRMPLEALFQPELRINFPEFVDDQILLYELATFLKSAPQPATLESIFTHFETYEFRQNLTAYLPYFYEACVDVLHGNFSKENLLEPAFNGCIFTLEMALKAQQDPGAIQEMQRKCGTPKQSFEEIQQEGAVFIRQALFLYLNISQVQKMFTFKERLSFVAGQLASFIQQMTRSYLREYKKQCPSDPLVFRNRQGSNDHGFVAASFMGVVLQVLGYKTRLMEQDSLEPKATKASEHRIVEVTGPDGIKYIVDPTYRQFHKDVRLPEDGVPTDPVLILEEGEVTEYVEIELMSYWKKVRQRALGGQPQLLETLKKNEMDLIYRLDQFTEINLALKPPNMERWVRDALTRVWDLLHYLPVPRDRAAQELLYGNEEISQTHRLIEPMGLAPLTSHRPYEELLQRLDVLLGSETPKNSEEAIRLLAELTEKDREQYASLLDIDPRVTDLILGINAYFRSLAKQVNPEGKELTLVYGCSGADVTAPLLSTDATKLVFVDTTKFTVEDFQQLRNADNATRTEMMRAFTEDFDFFANKKSYGGSISVVKGGEYTMKKLPLKLFLDLESMGVDLREIQLSEREGGAIQIDFPWEYYGSGVTKQRSLILITADITDPFKYPPLLQSELARGIDVFFMKGAFDAPQKYHQFLPHIGASLTLSGWLMTTDQTWLMESCNPEECLQGSGLHFSRLQTEEMERLRTCMCPSFHPISGASDLVKEDRIERFPNSNISYWSMLNLRQKLKPQTASYMLTIQ